MKTLREQMDDAMIVRGFATRTREAYLAKVYPPPIVRGVNKFGEGGR